MSTYAERGGSRRAVVEGARVRALLAQAKAAGDVVYWWRGGAEVGEWCEALPGVDIDATVREIERGGRVAVKGRRSIGPPEGSPFKREGGVR